MTAGIEAPAGDQDRRGRPIAAAAGATRTEAIAADNQDLEAGPKPITAAAGATDGR